jgi:carbon-monoxide dehydrogenase large subunit
LKVNKVRDHDGNFFVESHLNTFSEALGRSLPTSQAVAKVTGMVEFAEDLQFKGLLVGRVLRSPHPHARITHIDTSRAKRLSGVVTLISGEDFAGKYGPALMDQPVLARDVTRYAGEAIVAVAAEDADTAAEALDRVKVEYEPLPAVYDAASALRDDSPLVHPSLDSYEVAPGIFPRPNTNVCNHFRLRKGHADRILGSVTHVYTHTLTTQKTQHSSLEPHASIAQLDGSGRLRIWSNTQTPFVNRKLLGKAFDMPVHKIQLVVTRLGGGFGGKAYPKLEPIAAGLAMHSGNRPVRMVQTREEEFCGSTVTRHPVIVEVTTGLDKKGEIRARSVHLLFNTGAYADVGPRVCRNAAFSSPGPYNIPHVKVDADCVYTNTVPCGALRGFGIPQVTWAIESHTDMIAHELGFDPLEFRLKHSVEDGSSSATGQILHSVGLKKTLEVAGKAIKLGEKKPPGIGRGIACGHKSTVSPSASACVMRVNEDGTVQLLVSTVDMGQGSETVLAQIAAEELGIAPDRIAVATPDTDLTPYDMATVSSRSTFFMGNAIRNAAGKIKEQVLAIAAEMMEASGADLIYEKGSVYVKGSPSRGLALHEIPQGESFYAGAGQAGKGRPLVAEGVYTVEDATPLDHKTGQGAKPSAFWMYFSQAAEVFVDTDTGVVKVLKLASAHDVGKAINPLLLEGQIEGACMMGLGEALHEEMVYREGQVINPNFLDYRFPTFLEAPEIIPLIVECPHGDGPFGAKGMGEPALAAVAASVGNAVFDAVGIRITSLPITPEKVMNALKNTSKKHREKI